MPVPQSPDRPRQFTRPPDSPKRPSGLRRPVVFLVAGLLGGFVVFGLMSLFAEDPKREAKAAAPPKTDAVGLPSELQRLPYRPPAVPVAPPVPPVPDTSVKADTPKAVAPKGPATPDERAAAAKEARHAGILVPGTLLAPQTEEPSGPERAPTREERAGRLVAEGLSPHERFLARANAPQATAVHGGLRPPLSPWVVQQGTLIPVTLVTGINSDLPGYITAKVRLPVYAQPGMEPVLIPAGTDVFGAYDNQIQYGQSRVLIVWTRLLFPNRKTIELEGMPGVDLSGLAGLSGRVNNHLWPLARAVLLSSILNIGVRVPFGSPSKDQYYQTLPQEFAADFAQGAQRAGDKIVNRELSRPPTIDQINPGRQFNIMVHKDFVVEPSVVPTLARRR